MNATFPPADATDYALEDTQQDVLAQVEAAASTLAALDGKLPALSAGRVPVATGLDLSALATQTTLAALLAKVVAAPSTEAKQDAMIALLTAIDGHVDGLEGFTDGIEGLITTLNGYVDGLEALGTATGTKLDTLHTDIATTLAGYVDGLEALATTLNTYVDGLEGGFTTLNAKDFATQASLAAFLAANHADLAAILAKQPSDPSTGAKQDTGNTSLASILSAAGATGDASSASTLVGLLKAIKAAVTSTLLVGSASTNKGYQQLTSTAASATIASLCSGAALPTGATKCLIRTTAAVRFRDDGTNPSSTVGFPVAAGETLDYDGDLLSALKVYGAATLDVWFRA